MPIAREESVDQSVIAVQIANGTYVPVLSSDSRKRRKLVVTTSRDNQTNVKIELFKGSDESMADAEYVGSLVIDNIEAGDQGSADISVLLDVDSNGNLNATAKDDSSGEYQSLSVGLEQIGEDGGYDMPDFQISDEELSLEEISMDDEDEGGLPEDDFGADDLDLGAAMDTELPDIDSLSDDEAPADAADAADEADLSLDSFDELEIDDEPLDMSLETTTEEADEAAAADELAALTEEPSDGLDDLSLDDFSFDEEEDEDVITTEPSAEASDAPEADDSLGITDELEMEEKSLDLDEEEDTLSLDDFSLEDDEDEPAMEEVSDLGDLGDLGEPDEEVIEEATFEPIEESLEEPADEPVDAAEDASESADFATEEPVDASAPGGADDFDISMDDLSFDAEPTSEESSDGLESFADDDFGFDDSLAEDAQPQDGMVEADLGDEDFTFDEGSDDTPIFDTGDELSEDDAAAAEPDANPFADDAMSPEEFDRLDSTPEGVAADSGELAPRKSNGLIFAGYLVLALAALGVLTYLIFRLLEGPPAPPLRATGNVRFAALALLSIPSKWLRKRR